MPLPERVLIDYSAFCALLLREDPNHYSATEVYERLIDREQELWTTSIIIINIGSWLLKELGIESFTTFNSSIDGIIRIYWINENIYKRALESTQINYSKYGLGIDQCLTLEAANILEAHLFTFKECFSKIGKPILPRSQITSTEPL